MSATRLTGRAAIRARLQCEDRVWAAYALADLAPGLFEDCAWYASPQALALVYRGLQPQILMGMGAPRPLVELALALPAGNYALSWPLAALPELQAKAAVQFVPMFRMLLDRSAFQMPDRPAGGELRPLSVADAPAVEALIAPAYATPDEIDAFAPGQMADNTFFGAYAGGAYAVGELVGLAGTHIYSRAESVADIGNVYVRPDWRGRGWGKTLAAAVTAALIEHGIETIFLNVKQSNRVARHVYERLGYTIYCQFAEGLVQIY